MDVVFAGGLAVVGFAVVGFPVVGGIGDNGVEGATVGPVEPSDEPRPASVTGAGVVFGFSVGVMSGLSVASVVSLVSSSVLSAVEQSISG